MNQPFFADGTPFSTRAFNLFIVLLPGGVADFVLILVRKGPGSAVGGR